ncbi:MAG: VWA domain-containing protein [Oligoflexales bacterium]|nr:VWA domain-containing protein [Oligoflexales bacterium]
MEFAHNKYLFLIWVLPVLALLLWWAQKNYLRRLELFAAKSAWSYSFPQLQLSRFWLRALLILVAFLFLILSLAQPRWDYTWQEVRTKGVDIFVAIDVSKSMLAEDVQPSRLERAKREVYDLLGMIKGDRVGIISFAGTAFIQCPLTADLAASRTFLSLLDPSLVPAGGTAIGSALELAIEGLSKFGENEQGGKAVILITDGEDQGTDPLIVAEKAKKAGIKIFIVGIGSLDGAPIPLAEGGFVKDASGQLVISKLKESGLQELAELTGGVYVRSVAGDMDLEQIYQTGIRGSVESVEREAQRTKKWNERYHWFALVALLLLWLEALMTYVQRPNNVEKAGVGNTLVLVFFASLFTQFISGSRVFADVLKDAHKDFKEEKFQDAAEKFLEAEVADPEVLEHSYNRAVSDYKAKNFERAQQGFQRSTESKDPKIAADSFFNLGNTQAQMQQFDKAIESYNKALELRPNDPSATENAAWAKQMLEQQKQQKQNQDQDSDKKDDKKDDEKDDKKDDNDKKENEEKSENSDSKQEQSEQKDSKQQENSEQSEQEKKDQENQQAQNKPEQGEQKSENDKKNPEDKAADSQEEQAASENKDSEQQSPQAEQPPAQGFSKQEAERLLNALQDEGQAVRIIPQGAQKAPDKPSKQDW